MLYTYCAILCTKPLRNYRSVLKSGYLDFLPKQQTTLINTFFLCKKDRSFFLNQKTPSKSGRLGVRNSLLKCGICRCTDEADCTLPLQMMYTQATAFAWWLHIWRLVY